MLDNGYVYPAAARLSLYRSSDNWALVIETFGFSPRAGFPDTTITTFARKLANRKTPGDFVTTEAHAAYLQNNPHNEPQYVWGMEQGWQDPDNEEMVDPGASHFILRGKTMQMPSQPDYADAGVALSEPPRVAVFEFCRWLAFAHRDAVLATEVERRGHLTAGMEKLLQLEEWRHPDLAADEKVSASKTFQQLSRVLATGDVSHYRPSEPPNTHWSNWPEGGTL
jgi:hypothetical protein